MTAARAGYQLNVDAGVYVQNVTLQGPAGRAGIQRGDIILEVGGEKTNTVGELRSAVTSHNVGDTVSVKITRGDDTFNVDVTLDAAPEQ
jgi:serine protease Do